MTPHTTEIENISIDEYSSRFSTFDHNAYILLAFGIVIGMSLLILELQALLTTEKVQCQPTCYVRFIFN